MELPTAVAPKLCPPTRQSPSKPSYPFRGKLSLVPINGYPLAVAKQRLPLALPFLLAKNLLEPIKQISTAREAVPFLFVVIVVFNLGSHPEVCGMGEPLASAP